MTGDQGGVVVTLRDIYDMLLAVRADVSRLADQHGGTARQGTDHETRIRALERARWPLPTVSVLIAALAVVVSFWSRG